LVLVHRVVQECALSLRNEGEKIEWLTLWGTGQFIKKHKDKNSFNLKRGRSKDKDVLSDPCQIAHRNERICEVLEGFVEEIKRP